MPSLGRSMERKVARRGFRGGSFAVSRRSRLRSKKKAPPVAVSFDPLSTFTPAGADPKLAASFGSHGLSLTDFKFTPAAAKSRPSQVRVAIRARPDAPIRTRMADAGSASPVTALTPASYNLGAAVGWRRFAISGDVAKIESRNPVIGNKESAVVGVSYSLKRFTGRVAVGAERDERVAGASRARELFARRRRRLQHHPQPRRHRRRPLQCRARPQCRRSPTTAATARRSTSEPRSSSKRFRRLARRRSQPIL